MSAEQQAGVKRRSSRAAREGRRRRRGAARTTAAPTVQEATQAAIASVGEESQAQAAPQASSAASRAEARRQAKTRSTRGRTRRGFISSERSEGLRRFYRETMAEIKKVVWPDRETTRNLTLLVIALSVVLGILLGSLDFVLYEIFEAF